MTVTGCLAPAPSGSKQRIVSLLLNTTEQETPATVTAGDDESKCSPVMVMSRPPLVGQFTVTFWVATSEHPNTPFTRGDDDSDAARENSTFSLERCETRYQG